jgi:nitroreductase/NAD-dependent dihydropyrimidine dehydrogenase PreA subunit
VTHKDCFVGKRKEEKREKEGHVTMTTSAKYVLAVDGGLCVQCKACCEDCPTRVLDLADGAQAPRIAHPERCIRCGHCVAVCPTGAITAEGQPAEEPSAHSLPLTYEQLANHVKSRRSVRQFKPEPPSKEQLAKLLDAARYAPTGGNAQAVGYVVILEKANLDAFKAQVLDGLRGVATNPAAPQFIRDKLGAVVRGCERGVWRSVIASPAMLLAWSPSAAATPATDVVIALETVDLVAPTVGLATTWAGFVTTAMTHSEALQRFLAEKFAIPIGSQVQGLMIGLPAIQYHRIPPRNPANVTWA